MTSVQPIDKDPNCILRADGSVVGEDAKARSSTYGVRCNASQKAAFGGCELSEVTADNSSSNNEGVSRRLAELEEEQMRLVAENSKITQNVFRLCTCH